MCQSNQQQLSLLHGEVSQLRDELRAIRAAPNPSPQAASVRQTRAPTRASGPRSQSDTTCHFAGCSQQVSARCPMQFCRAHCTGSRCPVHSGRSPHSFPAMQEEWVLHKWCPSHAPAGSAKPITRASVADCIEAWFVLPARVAKSHHQAVWWACARRIAIIPNTALLPPRLVLPALPIFNRTAVL